MITTHVLLQLAHLALCPLRILANRLDSRLGCQATALDVGDRVSRQEAADPEKEHADDERGEPIVVQEIAQTHDEERRQREYTWQREADGHPDLCGVTPQRFAGFAELDLRECHLLLDQVRGVSREPLDELTERFARVDSCPPVAARAPNVDIQSVGRHFAHSVLPPSSWVRYLRLRPSR